jgi:flagellum-specific ATP synthase
MLAPDQRYGRVVAVRGALIEVDGLAGAARIGSRITLRSPVGAIEAEVVGLDHGIAHCMPFNEPEGIASGSRADLSAGQLGLRVSSGWLGRVVDGLGRPVDGKGPLPQGREQRRIKSAPPPASARARVGARIETGVRALDLFAPLCRGQRLGLFAGSGVGKSTLLSMLARWTECDVAVIGLIGERGREVQEFIQDDLGEEGLARSVVVVATSDEPALLRRQAAWTTLAVAEHFRDEGLDVLCLMDSVTRFAMAQREIGLAAGEPPTTKGYTPTVFTELPKLLERAGPGPVRPDGTTAGPITALFTVLVDGGDHDEPIADAVRGILDGHIVMDRKIAERGRFPAIDVLKSVSRTLPGCQTPPERELNKRARQCLSAYANMEELIKIGAYRTGADPIVDRAIALNPALEGFLGQDKDDHTSLSDSFTRLEAILNQGMISQ